MKNVFGHREKINFLSFFSEKAYRKISRQQPKVFDFSLEFLCYTSAKFGFSYILSFSTATKIKYVIEHILIATYVQVLRKSDLHMPKKNNF